MKLPNKLIVVGMRFQNTDVIAAFRKAYNSSIAGSMKVRLIVVDNEEGIKVPGYDKKVAYSVYCTVPGYGTQKIGYIRNKDLTLLDFCIGGYVNNYVITAAQANYLVLEPVKTEKAQYLHTDIPVYYEGMVIKSTNPCSEEPIFNTTNNEQTEKKETKMNTNSMRDSFFREVKNVVIDIQSGKMGVTSKDGIATFANGSVNVNPLVDFGVKIPAFAMRVELTALKEGDIIVNGDESTFFKALTDNGYEVVTLAGEVRQVGSVSNMFFGKNTVLAVKNMFGEGTNPMMMALLMGDEGFGGKGSDNKNLMLAMAMSGGMGGGADMGGMNPMMMMLLMNK